jgi:hypothetical protein
VLSLDRPHSQAPSAAVPDPAEELAQQLVGAEPAFAAGLLGNAPEAVALRALRRHSRAAGADGLALLAALLDLGGEPRVLSAAAEAIGEVPSQAAADLANHWSLPHVPRETRKAARRALLRLAQRGFNPAPVEAPRPEATVTPRADRVRRALTSAVDAQGTRVLQLLVDLPRGGGHHVVAIVSAAEGVLRFEAGPATGRQFERLAEEGRQQMGLAMVELPPAHAREIIATAAEASRARGAGLPPQFAAFREALAPLPGDADAVARHPVYEELEAAALRYRPDLVDADLTLLERQEFAGWQPEPESVAPLAEEWANVERSPLALPPSVVTQRRNAIMDRVVELVLGPGGAAGFRRRLEDNALVLLRSGETQAARRALATAMSLDPPDAATARANPFVRALAQQAIDLALEARERPERVAMPGESAAAPGSDAPTETKSGILVARSLPAALADG